MFIECEGLYEILLALAVAFIGGCLGPFNFDTSHRFCSLAVIVLAVLAAIFAGVCG